MAGASSHADELAGEGACDAGLAGSIEPGAMVRGTFNAWVGLGGATGLVALMAASACVQEDWGGPKGPPIGGASMVPSGASPSDAGSSLTGEPSEAGTSPAPPTLLDGPGSGGGDAGALTPRVDATLSGGKIPGFDEAIAGMRSTLKACVEGKTSPNARVEITARIGPKGTVLKSDKVGGTSFAQGAVPCLVKRIEAAQFKKPTEGAPRITFRVRMSND